MAGYAEFRCISECCLLLVLYFDPEDGGGIFLRNIGSLSKHYVHLYPRR
jgi:hypothetical protein